MSIFSSVAMIVPDAYTIASLVCCCINGISGRNRPVDANKLSRFFLFKYDNIVMNTLEAITELGDFNQLLTMRQSNNKFPYSGNHRHKYDAIKNSSLIYSPTITLPPLNLLLALRNFSLMSII